MSGKTLWEYFKKIENVKMMIEHLIDVGIIEAFQREPSSDYVLLCLNDKGEAVQENGIG